MIIPLKGTIGWLKDLDLETLEYFKYSLIGIIIADLLGIIWYLNLRKFGMVVFLSSLFFLAITLILERRQLQKMENETLEGKKEEEKEDDIGFGNMDLGLPDADEYNKKLEKALGSI